MIAVAWLLAASAVIGLCWWLVGTFVNAQPRAIIAALKLFAASFVAMAGMGAFALGRLGLPIAFIGAVALTAARLRAQQRPPDPLHGEAPGSSGESTIETAWMSMRLDRASGQMRGRVRRGRFDGRDLASLGFDELLVLRGELAEAEPASLPLLDTWLDRTQAGWRDRRGDDASRGTGAARPLLPMDKAAALEILGLAAGADRTAIEAAYRRVMSKVHPDKGGSDRLASMVNAARDFLLRQR